MKAKPERLFIPLADEHRPTVETAAYAHYMHIAEQTARIHAYKETGPIRPLRIPGSAKLHWPTAEIKRVLGIATKNALPDNTKALRFVELQAQFAKHGHTLHQFGPGAGLNSVSYLAERSGVARHLPTLADAEKFLLQIAGKA